MDTNVLVRYLVQDDPVQGPLAIRLVDDAAARREAIYLSCVVLAETAWVLTSVYRLRKHDLLAVLQRILIEGRTTARQAGEAVEFVVEHEQLVEQALGDYASGRADFTDYLIGRLVGGAGATTTYTFDGDAATAPTFKGLRRA